MIDFHCHILPGLDDGAANLDESLALARELVGAGFTAAVATPHLTEESGPTFLAEVRAAVQAVSDHLRRHQVPLKIYGGAEILLSPRLLQLMEDREALPALNGHTYLLLELPFGQPFPPQGEEIFFRLRLLGFQPVLAHPERTAGLFQHPRQMIQLAARGLFYQVNLASFTGAHGKASRKAALELLRKNAITFLGSDAHYPGQPRLREVPAALDLLRQEIGEAALYRLLHENPAQALAGRLLEQAPLPEEDPLPAQKNPRRRRIRWPF